MPSLHEHTSTEVFLTSTVRATASWGAKGLYSTGVVAHSPTKLSVVLDPFDVVQLTLLFQKFPSRGVISPTWVALMYSSDPLVRSMFHPGERERAGVDHCESSMA